MDTFNGTATRLPIPSKFLGRTKHKRPRISGPIGPIKNSRGPDFVRSESFTIVPGIKDCSSSSAESLTGRKVEDIKTTTRRISASFNKDGTKSLSSHPTVAESSFNVTTACQALPPNPLPKRTPLIPGRKVTLTTSSTFNIIPGLEKISQGQIQDENAVPCGSNPLPQKVSRTHTSQLPKSRTMSVLAELKTSISRQALTSRSGNSRVFSGSSRKTSQSSSNSNLLGSTSSSRHRLPRPSLVSSPQSTCSIITEHSHSTLLPGQISTAQPSAYWSGRFMSLHDRILAESLN
ncbi:hypothetical protein BGZ63DRAFT_401781 [Mariannaea sp. PMI_226]|nr:hypothetical protein BGZ63DRAFT_401781 [Mariannaea sp. PMI_226]